MLRLVLLLHLCNTIKFRWKKSLMMITRKAKDHNIISLGFEIKVVFVS